MWDPFREPVELSDADPGWSGRFADEAARITAALDDLSPAVEHIGSTSVPVRGKPIIDIQVAVDEAQRAGAVAALEDLGYRHHGEGGIPGRDYLTRRPPGVPGVNVHVFARQSSTLADNRVIRDYLRAHPDAAREYAQTKDAALEQGHTDLRSYSDAKAGRVAAVRDAAYRWARRPKR